ncbi:MAG: YoaK family protein, partial [Acidimicrobiales bacterium]
MELPSRRLPPLVVGIYLITCICGMLGAACFLGLGQVFAEIMTGNLVYLAFAIGTKGTATNLPVLPYVIALGTFAIGAVAGGRLVRLRSSLGRHRIAFAVEWLALACAVGATLILHPHFHGDARFTVIGILAFGLGIQDAAVRKWGVPDLATNVMTLTMTGFDHRHTIGRRRQPPRRQAEQVDRHLRRQCHLGRVLGPLWRPVATGGGAGHLYSCAPA